MEHNKTACVNWCDSCNRTLRCQQESYPQLNLPQMVKLMVMSPFILFIDPFFPVVGQQLSKNGPWNTVFSLYRCSNRRQNNIFSWSVLMKEFFLYLFPEILINYNAIMHLCFIQHVDNYFIPVPPMHKASIWFVNQLVTLKKTQEWSTSTCFSAHTFHFAPQF